MSNVDTDWLRMARGLAQGSLDKSTKVGAIIVLDRIPDTIVTGVNHIPPRSLRSDRPERDERPGKYTWYEHAERSAIFAAAKAGCELGGATMFVTSFPTRFPPCADCARAIVLSGITRVVQEPHLGDWERWRESCEVALELFKDAGVVYDLVEVPE